MSDVANIKVKLEGVRLSFPDLFEAKSINDSEPKFACSLLLDKEADSEQIAGLKSHIWNLMKAKWGADESKALIKKRKISTCLHEGAEKDYDGYDESNMFVTTSSKTRPHVVDRARAPLTKEDSIPYAGCYVNAVIILWVQDNQWGKKVNAEIKGVQFVKDGEPFGAPPFNPEEEFEELEKSDPKSKGKKAGASEGAEPDDDGDDIPF